MSNSEPRVIVLQGIRRICGLYKFRFEWRKRIAQGFAAIYPFQIAHRANTNVK